MLMTKPVNTSSFQRLLKYDQKLSSLTFNNIKKMGASHTTSKYPAATEEVIHD